MSHGELRRTVLLIGGMRDNECRERVVGILSGVRGVIDVEVNLIRSCAFVRHECCGDIGRLARALERAGFTARAKSASPCNHSKRKCSMNQLQANRLARDVMTAEPICVEASTSIRELAQIFETNEVSGVPVVDDLGKVIGVVSKTDLIRRCSEGVGDRPPAYLFELIFDESEGVMSEPLICVQDFMSTEPATVEPQAPLASVARLMSERRIHRVIVVDHECMPVGIVTTLDLLKAFAT